jgi:hypothetical protein
MEKQKSGKEKMVLHIFWFWIIFLTLKVGFDLINFIVKRPYDWNDTYKLPNLSCLFNYILTA